MRSASRCFPLILRCSGKPVVTCMRRRAASGPFHLISLRKRCTGFPMEFQCSMLDPGRALQVPVAWPLLLLLICGVFQSLTMFTLSLATSAMPTNHSTSQPNAQPPNQLLSQPTNHSTSKATTQPVNQPLNQPINHSTSKPSTQLANQPLI